jgi:two-component system cell cycle response regulator DivK
MQSGTTGEQSAHKVLIVEDNDLNMLLFKDILEVHGYQILQAKDGPAALLTARLHCPDLIVMDIDLPSMSGMEVAKQLKADDKLRSIPVVAVTALAMPGDEEMIRRAGCESYIAKPFSIVRFMQVIERYTS